MALALALGGFEVCEWDGEVGVVQGRACAGADARDEAREHRLFGSVGAGACGEVDPELREDRECLERPAASVRTPGAERGLVVLGDARRREVPASPMYTMLSSASHSDVSRDASSWAVGRAPSRRSRGAASSSSMAAPESGHCAWTSSIRARRVLGQGDRVYAGPSLRQTLPPPHYTGWRQTSRGEHVSDRRRHRLPA